MLNRSERAVLHGIATFYQLNEIRALFQLANKETVNLFTEVAHNICVRGTRDVDLSQFKVYKRQIEQLIDRSITFTRRRRILYKHPKLAQMLARST
jgi:hypothetical protein